MRKKVEKSLSSENIKKILSEVSDFESFWFCNNNVANSLESLSKLLLEVDDTTFRYHLHKNKNDYEDWIKNVIGDEEFSKEISRVKTRFTLSKKIEERILFLKFELKKLEKKSEKKSHSKSSTSKRVYKKSVNKKVYDKTYKSKKISKKNSESEDNIDDKKVSKLQLKKIVR